MHAEPVRSFVAFVCERFSLAIVGVGGVLMLLVFISVEVNAMHLGSYGVQLRGSTDVVDVNVPQGDLRTGDRIDLALLTPQQRFSLLGAPARSKLPVTAIRGNRRFEVTLVSVLPEYSLRAELARDIGIPICFFLSLGMASALFVMRPRPTTLAFYAYTVLMLVKVYQTPLMLAAWPINLVSDLLLQIVYPLTQLAILVFAQRLYGRQGRAWPWIFGLSVGWSLFVFSVWSAGILWLVTQNPALALPATRLMMAAGDVALLVLVLCGLAYIASGARGMERGRVTWIVSGIALAPMLDLTWALTDIASAIAHNGSQTLLAVEAWTDGLLPWVGLVGVVAVLYGFLSERVIDIRLAIGRAALYGGMTIVLVVLFGAIEWVAEQVFESTRPAMYVSLIAALLIGFG
ncbi:MAG TPA: hypothetical protein VMF61_11965, partial [Candidatus Acidoferrales bacterium]|nr:hypothetical protein [Candidatus Acidoferrales bacterium]